MGWLGAMSFTKNSRIPHQAFFFRILNEDMKTVIDLPDALFQSAQELSILENTPLPELIADLLSRALTSPPLANLDESFHDWRGELL